MSQLRTSSGAGDTRRGIRSPESLSWHFWKFDTRDRWWAGTMLVVILALLQVNFVYSLIWAAVTLASLTPTRNARLYEVVIRGVHRLKIERISNGDIVSDDKPRSRRLLPFDEIMVIREKNGVEVMSMMKLGRGSYGVLIVGDGAVTPTLEYQQQLNRTLALGRQLRQIVNLGVGWVMQIRPWNPWPYNEFKARALHDRALVPKSPIDPDTEEDEELAHYGKFLQTVMKAVEAVLHEKAREPVMAVPLVMAGNDALESSDGTINARALKRSPIVSNARRVLKHLRRYGVVNPRIATEAELVLYLRQVWDSKGLTGKNGYYKKMNDGRAGLAKFKDYLPQSVKYHDGCLEVDGNFITVVRGSTLPEEVEPGWLNGAFSVLDDDGNPINMTMATNGSVVSKKMEALGMGVFIRLRRTIEARYLNNRFRSSGNIERDREAVERERELGSNDRRMQDFLVETVIFATSLEDATANTDSVTNVLEGRSMSPFRVKDPDSMLDAVWASSGFCPM